ncbi:MAG TPA: Bcr/CflA family efflux MFS transporter [Desulfomicrobiaceae bacterium]|nr:Bcr/CflA family efflux MFS transporter [Desulfomicrobiaceae bacterium]
MNNFLLILLLTAFPALSTDMYLPAIPTLCEVWSVSLPLANLSLTAFFASFSIFLLIHGPLADQYGRRPILLGGVSIYIASCLACAASMSVTMLILARIFQAFGAAAAASMSLALAKDLYEGDARKKLLAYIGVLVPLCPMIAPTIGALLLSHASWRVIFLLQAVLALPALYGSFTLREPVLKPQTGGITRALKRYSALFRNRNYLVYALSFAVAGFAFFAFIGGSSDIYITGFDMNAQRFGLYFAFNAFGLMAGSLFCSRLCIGIASRRILVLSLSGMLLSVATLLVLGAQTPAFFALPMFFFTFFLGMSRPISNHVILEEVHQDTGTAASLLTFFNFMIAAVAMEMISFDWSSKPMVIAMTGIVGSAVPLLAVLFWVRPAKHVK